MRSAQLIVVLALAVWSGVAAAAPPGEVGQRVGRIDMQARSAASVAALSRSTGELVPGSDQQEGALGSPSLRFRVHELSRRRRQAEMRGSFARSREAIAAVQGAAAVAPVLNGPVIESMASGGPGRVAPVSAISAPLWMHGDRFLDASPKPYRTGCRAEPYRPSGFLTFATERRRLLHYPMMSDVACDYGIPIGLFDAMIIRESRYQPSIYSPKRAYGLTQLMDGTARDLGVDRYDVADNLRGGARYLRSQIDRFGRYDLALAAYNAGPARVRARAVPPIAETQAYVSDILGNWARLRRPAWPSARQEVTEAVAPEQRPRRAVALLLF